MHTPDPATEDRPERAAAPRAPRVSVCMAAYNGEAYLHEQLGSILGQLGAGDELVVVDDASTDGTLALLRAVDDPRVRVVESPTNQGYVRAFECALRHARGDVVLLADQDDVWEPGRVAPMVEALGRVDVVATNLGTLGGPDRIPGPYGQADWHLRAHHSRRHVRNVLGVLAGNRAYYGCAMGVRRSALDALVPFPAFLNESHDLWFALAGNVRRSIAHVEIRSVRRRFHAANASPARPRGPLQVLGSRLLLVRCLLELARPSRRA